MGTAAARAERANHVLLLLGGTLFALAPIFTGAAWRTALRSAGGRLGLADACARYGIGSLVNSVTPLRIGDGVRVALFARALPSGLALRGLGAFLALKLARLAVLAGLAGIAFGEGRLDLLAAGCGGVAVALARAKRATSLVILIAASTAARIAAIALVLASLQVDSPVKLACAIVPALAIASLLPLTPGNLGVASAAVAVSLQIGGIGLSEGVPIGIVLHAVETAAGLLVGTASGLFICAAQLRISALPLRRFVTRTSPTRRPRLVG